nr:MAG TPA: hypothetical protein [Caudoviricetes sp.]
MVKHPGTYPLNHPLLCVVFAPLAGGFSYLKAHPVNRYATPGGGCAPR